jgi:hypothetical protein
VSLEQDRYACERADVPTSAVNTRMIIRLKNERPLEAGIRRYDLHLRVCIVTFIVLFLRLYGAGSRNVNVIVCIH